jgi:hypothetical protein
MKVIGIGLEKTGTTTLKTVLKILGFNFCHEKDAFFLEKYQTLSDHAVAALLLRQDYQDFYRLAEQYDAFSDTPWPWLYPQIDQQFPGSKFILTVRDEKKWIKSMVKYFGNIHSSVRELYYGNGAPLTHEEQYVEVYRNHLLKVKQYFQNRPNDLLIVNWENGDDWGSICQFLNKSQPRIAFPHENKYQSHHDKPKTFISGTLLLPKKASTQLDSLYFSFKNTSGIRPSFVAFPDLKDSGQQAVRRFIAGMQPRNHLAFIANHIENFDCYCSLLPIPFTKIDQQYPGSKFVFLQAKPHLLQDTFLGKLKESVPWLPSVFIRRYAAYLRAYETKIQQYFKGRGHDFLSVSVDQANLEEVVKFYNHAAG